MSERGLVITARDYKNGDQNTASSDKGSPNTVRCLDHRLAFSVDLVATPVATVRFFPSVNTSRFRPRLIHLVSTYIGLICGGS